MFGNSFCGINFRKLSYYVSMFRCIEEYLINVKNRTKQHEEMLKKEKEEKDIVHKYLFDQLISLTVSMFDNLEVYVITIVFFLLVGYI